MGSGPLQFQEQHRFVSHPSCPPQDRLDGGVDRLDDAEANGMIAVGRDPLDVLEEEVAEALHLGQALPAERLDPPKQEGVKISDPLTLQWWGDRTFKVLDPNGYEIWFYTNVAEPKPPQGAKLV